MFTIQVDQLAKSYGKTTAVHGISFNLKKGEITGFLGPNGAGKSTTLNMLMGLTTPSSGRATILGLDTQTHAMEIKKQVGYLAEFNPLYPDMYVKEFLTYIGNLHQLKGTQLKNRVADVIEMVGLTQEKHKKIQELSKGFQQRVGIAQSILHDPAILILDEPTSGLDPNQMEEIRHLIVRLKQDKTILFSSHLLGEVEAICDQLLIINQGHLKVDSSMQEAKEFPGGISAFFKDKTA